MSRRHFINSFDVFNIQGLTVTKQCAPILSLNNDYNLDIKMRVHLLLQFFALVTRLSKNNKKKKKKIQINQSNYDFKQLNKHEIQQMCSYTD